ncbi:MAG: glycosyltransferase family 4 protein [Thermodesulfobacteriota bacterium]|nr:glycosyltransferase family 4 protein [Thermodesulfobacteriota bacterium]
MKIWLIQNFVSIYREKLFEAISKTPGVDFTLILLTEGSLEYPREFDPSKLGFKAERVKGLTYRRGQTSRISFNPGLLWKMLREKPDVMIACGYSFATILTMLYKLMTGAPYVIWSESTKETEKNFSRLRIMLRKRMINYSDGFVIAGELSREYVESFLPSGHDKKFFLSYNCSDKDFFFSESEKYRHDEDFINNFRARFPKKNMLFVGQLIERKGISQLLHAYKLLTQRCQDAVGLIMLGDGSLRSHVENFKRENSLDHLYIEGMVDYKNIPKYYSFVDLSILLSIADPNPLVVFESLYCGVPVVCSNKAGNYYDFITERKNGCVVDPDDTKHIVECIKYFLDEADSGKVKEFSMKSVEMSNYAAAAKGFIDAARHVSGSGVRSK